MVHVAGRVQTVHAGRGAAGAMVPGGVALVCGQAADCTAGGATVSEGAKGVVSIGRHNAGSVDVARIAAALPRASESFRRLNGLPCAGSVGAGTAGTVAPVGGGWWVGPESAFQAAVELHLEGRGYARRSRDPIANHTGQRWYFHIPRTIGNPIVMDLVLFDSRRGRYVEIELKTAKGRPSDHQAALLARGEIVLCRSMDEVDRAVTAFEALP